MNKIGVIGAGQMGNGIAHVCALAGYKVLLNDVSEERIQAGLATIDGNLARQVALRPHHGGRPKGGARPDRAGRVARALADADLVIESVTENETVKRKIFAELCPLLRPKPSSPPTPPPSPSPALPRPPTGRSASSACTS